MKFATLVCLMIVLSVSVCLAGKIDGKWLGKIQGPEGDMELTFTYTVVGDSLTGSVGSPWGDTPISNGKINGNEFSYDLIMGEMTIGHHCTLDGDTVKVKVTGLPEPAEMVLKRAPAEK